MCLGNIYPPFRQATMVAGPPVVTQAKANVSGSKLTILDTCTSLETVRIPELWKWIYTDVIDGQTAVQTTRQTDRRPYRQTDS